MKAEAYFSDGTCKKLEVREPLPLWLELPVIEGPIWGPVCPNIGRIKLQYVCIVNRVAIYGEYIQEPQ
jgi:hypothetical protein